MNLEALLSLGAIPGIGANRLRALVNHFGTPEAALAASVPELEEVPGIDEILSAAISGLASGSGSAAEQLRCLSDHDARVVTWRDADYPAYLKQIYDPPAVLFVKGRLPDETETPFAVVGSRVPSLYGRMTCERLSAGLSRHGLTIVSGMARGIDGIAHRSALSSGGRTIGVLGCGLDVVYPAEHRRLYGDVAGSGALVSEFPMGTPPDAHNFPRRNRLISGMSLAVLVVEAREKSGALLTAKLALEQGRDVFAVPGNIDSPRSRGPNLLIQQGAKLVLDPEDIVEELVGPLGGVRPSAVSPPAEDHLSREERLVLDGVLPSAPRHVDAIAAECGFPTSKVVAALLGLELAGLVRQLPGNQFVRGA